MEIEQDVEDSDLASGPDGLLRGHEESLGLEFLLESCSDERFAVLSIYLVQFFERAGYSVKSAGLLRWKAGFELCARNFCRSPCDRIADLNGY